MKKKAVKMLTEVIILKMISVNWWHTLRERFITVIPEIEMPAHSEEVLTAYPELSCTHEPYKQTDFCVGNEKTFEFLENVLTEVMELFPSEYIHIGGMRQVKPHGPLANCARHV